MTSLQHQQWPMQVLFLRKMAAPLCYLLNMDLMASIFAAWIVILMLLAWQTVHKRYKIRKPLKMSRGIRVRQRKRCSSNHCWCQKPFVTCMTMQNEIVQYRVHGWEWHPFSFSSSTQSRLLIHLLFHFDAVDFLRQGLRKYMAMLMCMNGWHELIFCLLVGSLAGSCVAACMYVALYCQLMFTHKPM